MLYLSMTFERKRKTVLEQIAESAAYLEQLRMQTATHERVLRGEIRSAIATGESVTDIAAAAMISRERVYQIRDDRR